jgi:hypothetical protein
MCFVCATGLLPCSAGKERERGDDGRLTGERRELLLIKGKNSGLYVSRERFLDTRRVFLLARTRKRRGYIYIERDSTKEGWCDVSLLLTPRATQRTLFQPFSPRKIQRVTQKGKVNADLHW